jgi:hypothetical protein
MHIMINGNYLSLDDVLIVTGLKNLRPSNMWTTFKIIYRKGGEVDFYQQLENTIAGQYGTTFYFKTEDEITEVYNRIITILTNNAA